MIPALGDYRPYAGVEFGLSARGSSPSEEPLLRDLRESQRGRQSPVYVAVHAAPLRFVVLERFRLSLLELQFGAHVAPLGERVRVQLGLISWSMVL
jgi:hypothetical protein